MEFLLPSIHYGILFGDIFDFSFLKHLELRLLAVASTIRCLWCLCKEDEIKQADKQKSIDITVLGEVNLDVKNSPILFLFFGLGLFLLLPPEETVTQLAETTLISRTAFKIIWFRVEWTGYSFENVIAKLLSPFPSSPLFTCLNLAFSYISQ